MVTHQILLHRFPNHEKQLQVLFNIFYEFHFTEGHERKLVDEVIIHENFFRIFGEVHGRGGNFAVANYLASRCGKEIAEIRESSFPSRSFSIFLSDSWKRISMGLGSS